MPEVTRSASCRAYTQSSVNSNLCVFNSVRGGRSRDPYFPLCRGCWEAQAKPSPKHGCSSISHIAVSRRTWVRWIGFYKAQRKSTCIEWMNHDFPVPLKVVEMRLASRAPLCLLAGEDVLSWLQAGPSAFRPSGSLPQPGCAGSSPTAFGRKEGPSVCPPLVSGGFLRHPGRDTLSKVSQDLFEAEVERTSFQNSNHISPQGF